jgi:hypothetical protein
MYTYTVNVIVVFHVRGAQVDQYTHTHTHTHTHMHTHTHTHTQVDQFSPWYGVTLLSPLAGVCVCVCVCVCV